MKKLVVVFILILFAAPSFASGGAEALSPLDRWPWNWGSECPFPWKSVDGSWVVKSLVETGDYHGHRLEIDVEDDSKPDSKLLKITQYDESGSFVASGEGYTEGEDRVITAYMSPVRPGGISFYKVIVRSYDKRVNSRAVRINVRRKRHRIFAATFCSPRGRKCLEDSNYILRIGSKFL